MAAPGAQFPRVWTFGRGFGEGKGERPPGTDERPRGEEEKVRDDKSPDLKLKTRGPADRGSGIMHVLIRVIFFIYCIYVLIITVLKDHGA